MTGSPGAGACPRLPEGLSCNSDARHRFEVSPLTGPRRGVENRAFDRGERRPSHSARLREVRLMSRLGALAIVACLLAPMPVPGDEPAGSGPPLKVLFLGDRGHHRPADRAAQLTPVMHDRGIEVTYTERLDDLNPKT